MGRKHRPVEYVVAQLHSLRDLKWELEPHLYRITRQGAMLYCADKNAWESSAYSDLGSVLSFFRTLEIPHLVCLDLQHALSTMVVDPGVAKFTERNWEDLRNA